MAEKTVTVEIDEHGNSSIDLEGFQGKGCADVAKAFQGHDVVAKSRTKQDSYLQPAPRQVRQRRP